MADLTLTPANVIPSINAQISTNGIAGATIVAGNTLYRAIDGTLKLCDSNAASPIYSFYGIAVNSAAPGQPVAYVVKDPALAIGGAQTAGAVLKVSTTPGNIAPIADAISGEYVTVLGVVNSDGTLNLNPSTSTGAKP